MSTCVNSVPCREANARQRVRLRVQHCRSERGLRLRLDDLRACRLPRVVGLSRNGEHARSRELSARQIGGEGSAARQITPQRPFAGHAARGRPGDPQGLDATDAVDREVSAIRGDHSRHTAEESFGGARPQAPRGRGRFPARGRSVADRPRRWWARRLGITAHLVTASHAAPQHEAVRASAGREPARAAPFVLHGAQRSSTGPSSACSNLT